MTDIAFVLELDQVASRTVTESRYPKGICLYERLDLFDTEPYLD